MSNTKGIRAGLGFRRHADDAEAKAATVRTRHDANAGSAFLGTLLLSLRSLEYLAAIWSRLRNQGKD